MLETIFPYSHSDTLYNKAKKKVTGYCQKVSASPAKFQTDISDVMSQHNKKGDITFRAIFIVIDNHASDRAT